jgi:hypothetical protein
MMFILSLSFKVQQQNEHKLKVNNSNKDLVKRFPSRLTIVRYMKSMSKSSLLNQAERKLALVNNVLNVIEKIFSTPVVNKTNFVDKISHTFITPGENLVRQTITKGIFSRFSEKKLLFLDSMKNQTNIYEKIILKNLNKKADIGLSRSY